MGFRVEASVSHSLLLFSLWSHLAPLCHPFSEYGSFALRTWCRTRGEWTRRRAAIPCRENAFSWRWFRVHVRSANFRIESSLPRLTPFLTLLWLVAGKTTEGIFRVWEAS